MTDQPVLLDENQPDDPGDVVEELNFDHDAPPRRAVTEGEQFGCPECGSDLEYINMHFAECPTCGRLVPRRNCA